jgi:hypothetical protein
MGLSSTEVGGMPKEITADDVSEHMRVEVSWRNANNDQDGHVQIATVDPHSPFEFPEKDTAEHFESAEKFDGWRVTLSRAGINRLIHSLRKARDAAYGKDA